MVELFNYGTGDLRAMACIGGHSGLDRAANTVDRALRLNSRAEGRFHLAPVY